MTTKRKSAPYVGAYLKDPNVSEWYRTLAMRSEGTADSYLRSMARIWNHLGLSPDEFVDRPQLELDRLCQSVLNHWHGYRQENGRPLSEGVLKSYRSAMVSWLEWNGRKAERKLIVGRAPVTPRVEDYFIPENRQLQAVLDAATVRTRACIALTAFGGLRFAVQGSHSGNSGLMLSHVQGIELQDGRAVVESLPLRVDVPAHFSKNGRAYFTLIGPEGADYILAYLNARLEAGEVLAPESPLIAHEKGARNNSRSAPFLLTKTITEAIRKAHKKAGLRLPPYIWRSYFDTRLLLAESKGLCVQTYREFWMGHSGDMEATYTVRKTLPKDVMADMEQRYMASFKLLATRSVVDEADAGHHVMLAFFHALGCTDDELAALDLDNPDAGAVQTLVQSKVAAMTTPAPVVEPAPPVAVEAPQGPSQRLVDMDDLETWLNQGWTWAYEAPAPAGKALVKAPAGNPAPSFTGQTEVPVAA